MTSLAGLSFSREQSELLDGTPAADAFTAAHEVCTDDIAVRQRWLQEQILRMRTPKGTCRSLRPALALARDAQAATCQLTLCVPAQHVRRCYDAALPALSALTEAFPDDIPPEHVSQEAFLWATQLWYSYGMEVSRFFLIQGCISPSARVRCLIARCAMSGVA